MAAETDADVKATGPGMSRSRLAVLRQLRGHATRRLGWGLADQVVSSLTNYAVSIYVVHALGAVQFGAFSLAYVTYGFALNASRGLATDPLMVRFSGTDLPTWRRAVAGCTGTATVVGLATGACVVAAAALLTGAAGVAFLALGLTLPGLLLQDSWRYSFFALGRGSQAFLNDTIWALTLLAALAVLRATGHADVFWSVFAWGATAAIAAAAGPWQARVIPRPAGAWKWVSQHRDLGPRYLAEGTSQSAAVQVRAYSIGLVLGLAALGSVQAAATLFGPMTILFLGMSLVTIPEAARVLRRSPRHLSAFCLVTTGALSAAGLIWGIILLVAVPRGLGHWLLGPIWRSTYPLVLPQMIFVIGQGVGFGVGTGLHALAASRRSLRLTLLMAILYVIGSMTGAVAAGAVGTVWGAAVSQWIAAVYGWWQLHAAQQEAGHLPASHRFWLIRPHWRRRGRPVPAAARVLLATGSVALVAVVAVGWMMMRESARTHETAGVPAKVIGAQGQAGAAGHAPTTTYPRARTRALKPVSAVSFDPYGDGLGENSQLAYLAIDGSPATAWRTEWYASASFGGLKPGTGLLLDMGRTMTISTVQLLLGSVPGASFQVRVGAVASSLTDLHPVAYVSDAGGHVSLDLTTPARGRYVLIWFTQLPPDASSGTFQASVYNVSLRGWA
jgi:O-antigen/teichoic acid export membrane protein